jgi:hypothetical protein
MILREEMGKAPDALPCEPLPDERLEIVVCREISSGEPPVAFQVALFQEEKSGNEAVPRVSDKGKLETSIEHLLGHHRPEILQRPMPALPSKKTLANRRSRAFRDVHEHALFCGSLLLNQAKAMRMTDLEPRARQIASKWRRACRQHVLNIVTG